MKWNVKYQKKYGIESGPARDLAEDAAAEIQHVCKRAYRALELSGYARIDLRLDEAGNVWVLEANPNPQIARGEDFAASAEKAGLSYEACCSASSTSAALAAGERRLTPGEAARRRADGRRATDERRPRGVPAPAAGRPVRAARTAAGRPSADG